MVSLRAHSPMPKARSTFFASRAYAGQGAVRRWIVFGMALRPRRRSGTCGVRPGGNVSAVIGR